MTIEKARVWRKIFEGMHIDYPEEIDFILKVLESDPLGGPIKVRMKMEGFDYHYLSVDTDGWHA